MKSVLIVLGLLLVVFLLLSAFFGNGDKDSRAVPEVLRVLDVVIVLLILGISVISFSLRQQYIEEEKENAKKMQELDISVPDIENDFIDNYPEEEEEAFLTEIIDTMDDVSGQDFGVSENE